MNKMRSALKLSRTTLRTLGSDDAVLGAVQGGNGQNPATIGTIGTIVDGSHNAACSAAGFCNSNAQSNCVNGCGGGITVRTRLGGAFEIIRP